MEMLSYWYQAFKRHPILSLGASCCVLVLTVVVILYYPRTYRSRAQLLLRVGHENMAVDPTVEATGQMVQMQLTRKNDIENSLQVMKSRAVLGDVVEQLGHDVILNGFDDGKNDTAPSPVAKLKTAVGSRLASIDPISDRERALRELSKKLDVSAKTDASVVTAEFRAKSPEAAKAILDVWLDAYLSKHIELHRTSGSLEFFEEQETGLRTELDSTYQSLREAKTSNRLVTVEGQQKLLEGQLASVRTAIAENEAALAGSTARSESLRQLLAQTADRTVTDEVSGIANEARDSMRGRLFELEVLEREYAAKYKSDHPRLTTIRNQLAEAKRIVDQQTDDRAEVTSGINPVYQQLQQELHLEEASKIAFRRRVEILARQREQLHDEIASLNETEQKIKSLERQAAILENRYASHSERLEESRIDEELREKRITSVTVVQSASYEERPVTPDKKMTAALGVLAMIAALVGLPLVLASPEGKAVAKSVETHQVNAATDAHKNVSVSGTPDEGSLLHPMFVDDGVIEKMTDDEAESETRRVAR